MATGLALASAVPTAEVAGAAPGVITGTVFRDFNGDGDMDTAVSPTAATDIGVGGVIVEAFDRTGASVGTATTGPDGTYSLAYVADGPTSQVRVELRVPAGYRPTAKGTAGTIQSGTTVQFVTDGAEANLGIARLGDHSQDSPQLVIPVHRGVNSNLQLAPPTSPTLYALDYTTTGVPAVGAGAADLRPQATLGQTGTVWGIAPYGTSHVFSAALLKRHAPIGPGGLGAIYMTTLTPDGSAPNATPFALIPDPGVNPRTGTSAAVGDADLPGYDWFRDADVFAAIHRVGLGDIDISPDLSTLYVVNLNDRSLYRVPVNVPATPGGAPTSGSPVSLGMPIGLPGAAVGCADPDVRPFGIHVDDEAVWVGLTCTGPMASDLRAYVYRYDIAAGSYGSAPAFETELGGNRGGAYFSYSANWRAWNDVFDSVSGNADIVDPQPLLSDIEIDSNGDMSLAFKDRNGDQTGEMTGSLEPSDVSTYIGFTAGDVLRACVEGPGWLLESNGSCGSRLGYGPGNGQGPGGGEFYYDDYLTASSHYQINLGATEQVPGFAQIITTAYDPHTNVRVGGFQKLNNLDGGKHSGTELTGDARFACDRCNGTFSKADGIGDIEALLEPAPVEIGNRTWYDADGDGIQDADEPAIPGVTVTLTDPAGNPVVDAAGNPILPVVTDADGEYYFRNLIPGQDYRVVFDHSTADVSGLTSEFGITTADELSGTVAGADGDDDADSNPDPDTGVAPVSVGGPGENDHTVDAGYVAQRHLEIAKEVDGIAPPGSSYTVSLTCTDFRGDLLTGSPLVLELDEGDSEPVAIPAGASCTVTETGTGGADEVAYSVDGGPTSATPPVVAGGASPNAPVQVEVINAFDPVPAIDIVKFDGRATLPDDPVDGHDPVDGIYGGPTAGSWDPAVDADTPADAVVYPISGGTTGPQPVGFIITNTGPTALADLRVADTTLVGASVTHLSCDFSPLGGPDAGTTWAGPLLPGDSFTCSARLEMSANQTHADTASVVAHPVNPETGLPVDETVGDEDQYHAETPNPGGGIDIEKFDDAFGTPDAYDPVDVNAAVALDADTPDRAVVLVPDEAHTIRFAVANTGDEALIDVAVSDRRTAGVGDIEDLSCDFSPLGGPASGTRWDGPFAPGDHFYCAGTLTLGAGVDHVDRATVTATGAETGRDHGDDDDFHAETPDLDQSHLEEPPASGPGGTSGAGRSGPLPRTGAGLGGMALLGLGLALAGFVVSRRRRSMVA